MARKQSRHSINRLLTHMLYTQLDYKCLAVGFATKTLQKFSSETYQTRNAGSLWCYKANFIQRKSKTSAARIEQSRKLFALFMLPHTTHWWCETAQSALGPTSKRRLSLSCKLTSNRVRERHSHGQGSLAGNNIVCLSQTVPHTHLGQRIRLAV